jgi:hypothetical protein
MASMRRGRSYTPLPMVVPSVMLHGEAVGLNAPPADTGQRPNPDALRWHYEHVFRG